MDSSNRRAACYPSTSTVPALRVARRDLAIPCLLAMVLITTPVLAVAASRPVPQTDAAKESDKSDKSAKNPKPPTGAAHKVIQAGKAPALNTDKSVVVVELTNGDRITGTGVQISNNQLKMNSDAIGAVTIPLKQVKQFALADKLMVVANGEAVPADKVSLTKPNQLQLDESGKVTTLPAASVKGVYPTDVYNDRLHRGWRPWIGWHGNANAGYTLVGGNGQSSTFAEDALASRSWPGIAGLPVTQETKFSFGAQMGVGTTTGYRLRVLDAGLGHRLYFTPRSFLFLYGQLDHIYSQQLYLQLLGGGGYGYRLIDSGGVHFDLQAGLLYVHDHFFAPYPGTSNPSAMAGETLDWKIGDRTTFHHSAQYEPAVNHTGFYQLRTDTQFTMQVVKALSFHTSLRDVYLNQVPGKNPHRNSVTLATGIGVTF